MPKSNKSGLIAALRASVTGRRSGKLRAEDEENSDIEDEEEDQDAADTAVAEGDDDDAPDAAENDDDDTDGDEDEDGEDTGPAASSLKTARNEATKTERARCLAIMSHAKADASPNLAAKLLTDGTPKARAMGLLDAVEGGAAKTSGSLAGRIAESQGNKKPGQDAGASTDGKSGGKSGASTQLVSVASSRFGRRKAKAANAA